jgi:hypothetical protein
MDRSPPKSARLILEESNRVGVQFLLADLAIALTFLNVADATHSPESRSRNHQNAVLAYQTVVRLIRRLTPSAEEHEELHAKLAILKSRLAAIGLLDNPETTKDS